MSAGPLVRPETIETLRDAQRFGFLGSRPVEQAAQHSLGFVHALDDLPLGARVIDIGSGGGLPGLVLADGLPGRPIVLVDRRQKRTDFLARAVSRLGLTDVRVRCADVAELAQEVADGSIPPFAAVTARGFGPPDSTLRLARRLIAVDGVIVISEPPSEERWDPALLAELSLVSELIGPVRRFRSDVSRETSEH
jgi:16S rRNA (guanine527-N7)-methyltransferase